MKTKSIYCFFEPVVLLFKKSRSEFSEQEKNALKVAPFSKGRACPPPVWFRSLLNYTLCVLLAFSPVYSFPQPPPIEGPKGRANIATPATSATTQNFLNGISREFLDLQQQTAEEFNKKVETLNQHIFGPRDLETHYKDHSLDFYSLIHQKVEMQKASFWERHNPWHKETKTLFNKLKPSERRKAKEQTQEGLGENIISVFGVGDGFNQAEQEKLEKEKPSASESEHTPRPFFTEIKPKNLVVNIVVSESQTTSTDSKQEIVVGRINSQGDKINSLAYGPKLPANFDSPLHVAKEGSYHKAPVSMPHYTGKSFVIPQNSQELYNFNISYQGQVLHRFSNNIQWISFVGPYLVFMEPSRVYKNKAELSFIDLSYFHSAIGKTALPVFHIPLALKSKAKKVAVLNPLEIGTTEEGLILRGQNVEHNITKQIIDETSRIHQVFFNILVSMLSTDKYERDMLPFFKEIATKFEEVLNQQLKTEKTNNPKAGDFQQSKRILKQVMVEILKNRVDIGSPLHHAGHYGEVKASQHRINSQIEKEKALLDTITQAERSVRQGAGRDPETEKLLRESRQALRNLNINNLDKETYTKSVEHLKQDQAFQTALKQLNQTKFGRRELLDRLKGLWVYLTLPQPLGAPKIQESLGLMANALRSQESIQDRFTYFKEGLKQLGANPKARFVGIPVLAGMAGVATPEVANFFSNVFSVFRSSVEVFASTSSEYMFKHIPAFLSPAEWSRAYVEDGNIGPFAKGIGAVSFAMLLFYYAFHIPVNIKKFLDYLKTEKAKSHASKVLFYLTHLPSYFKAWAEQEQSTYYRDLAVGEFKNLGLPVTMSLADGSKKSLALQTVENVSNLMSDFKNKDFNINLEVQINKGEEVLRFSSVGAKGQPPEITLDISPQPEERTTRSFFLKEGYLTDMFQDGQLVENVFIEITGNKPEDNKTTFLYKAKLIGLHFTKKEMSLLQESLTGTKYQAIYDKYVVDPVIRQAQQRAKGQRDFAENVEHLSDIEISFLKSLQTFFFSFPSFNNTQKVMNPTWNVWFLLRSLWFTALYPHRLATLLFFSNYFERAYGEMHQATSLNGGFRLRGTELIHKTYPTGREYLSALKEFEKEIIQVERRYLRVVSERAYLQALKDALQEEKPMDFLLNEGVRKQLGRFNFLPSDDPIDKNNPKLSLRDGWVSELYQSMMSFSGATKNKLSRQDSFFIELYQNKLFEESMRSYIQEQLGISSQASNREVLKQIRARIKSGEGVVFRTESLDEIRDRVRAVSANKNIAQKMKENMASWHKAFFEKLKVKHNRNMSNMLNPRKNLQLERFHVSKVLGKDPEAMARATRYSMVGLIIDRPFELLILFMMMAGISEGILKMLYSEPFNERAFFYMSAFLVWAEFFLFTFVLNTLSASWDKLQMDSRNAFKSAFDKFPTQEEVNKKFAAIKYFWKRGFGKKDSEGKIDKGKVENTLWENYKFSIRLIVSNLAAAFPTMALGYMFALGRFDVELFLGGYIVLLLLALSAIVYKLEGIYELSAGYAARDLIRKGIDIKKFAHHPVVQQILIKRSVKDRIIYNLINAIAVNNILENSARIVENVSASDGVRSIHRAFFKEGHLLTEYWDKISEQTSKVFSTAGDICKKAFTNNRLDIME